MMCDRGDGGCPQDGKQSLSKDPYISRYDGEFPLFVGADMTPEDVADQMEVKTGRSWEAI